MCAFSSFGYYMRKVEVSVTWLNGQVTTKKISVEQLLNAIRDVRNKNISLEGRNFTRRKAPPCGRLAPALFTYFFLKSCPTFFLIYRDN